MTYGELKKRVLQLIFSYSVAGSEIPATYNNQADYLAMIPGLVNNGQMDIATSVKRLPAQVLIDDLETFGFLFEALCERDLKIYAESFGAQLYHYQDYAGNEIDAVVELPDGGWCGIEIKLGANQIDDAAEKLISIRDAIANEKGRLPSALCVVCGLSNAAYRRPDGVFVVPITALKN